ncbi:MAG: NADP-dependent malic enzyme [Candidatus Yonathbacteria bacterium]|nr:NADP-dependent malic enzyme [Candidatus Yonathbacteria bacterium]NTW47363.1 NADP-dependent malic enzyme [Candidatus Yonathbacteria bacterium]
MDPLDYHRAHRGKIEIKPKAPLNDAVDLALAYTPGVGKVCMEIVAHPEQVNSLTNKSNTIAIVSDGSAILGLGNIGPEAGLPVMEGKAMIFKTLADVDAVPLCIATQDAEEIVRFCKQIAPSFGGINLEDISAPRCFDILDRLEKELSIPVFHDDQDGTAIVALAALINATKVRGGDIRTLKIVVNGAGAAGIAIARLFSAYGISDIILVDSKGIVALGRDGMNVYKEHIANISNPRGITGSLSDALIGVDAFVGVSGPGLLSQEMVRSMAPRPIIFAMANPEPEILPDDAKEAGAFIIGTGRSDFPNQINNALVFPGIFRALLDANTIPKKCVLSEHMTEVKIATAEAIASVVTEPTPEHIMPTVMDPAVVPAIRAAICG